MGMGLETNGLRVFQVCFLDMDGSLIQRVSIPSESLMGASDRAQVIAIELSAADFFITAAPYPPPLATPKSPPNISKPLTPLSRLIFSFVNAKHV